MRHRYPANTRERGEGHGNIRLQHLEEDEMIIKFLRFYFSRTSRNGVALRKAIKAAMPQVKSKPKPAEPAIPASIRK